MDKFTLVLKYQWVSYQRHRYIAGTETYEQTDRQTTGKMSLQKNWLILTKSNYIT